jgi:SHS2 domain-containing protein
MTLQQRGVPAMRAFGIIPRRGAAVSVNAASVRITRSRISILNSEFSMYEILQHTADVRISVTAATIDALFAESLLALMEVMGGDALSEPIEETLTIDSVDRTSLLIDFLNEALLRCHLRRQRYTSASFSKLTESSLAATLHAAPIPEFAEDVKAVTYHEADVQRGLDGWTTRLVLDI